MNTVNEKIYDVIIIGGGPAGYSASIYTARALLKTLLITSLSLPPQVVLTDVIENYPGFPEGINGFEFVEKLRHQAEKFNVEILTSEVIKLEREGKIFKVLISPQEAYLSKAIIIAVGRRSKKLGVEGEQEFTGRGVSYCAVCDAAFYKDKIVAVVGGGNTAFTEANFLAKFVKKLYLVHRREQFRATKILQQRLLTKANVETLTPYIVEKLQGDKVLSIVILRNVNTHELKTLNCDGIFICIGHQPNTEFVRDIVETDEEGYIITDENLQTSTEGIYACGDCRKGSVKQVVNACAEGVHAALSVIKYLES